MFKRVDTTNVARGDIISLVIFTEDEPTIESYFFDTSTHEATEIQYTIEQNQNFFKATTKTPTKDGYIVATINSKYNYVKKIGHPTPHFVIGYKKDYTIPFKLYAIDGTLKESGNLKSVAGSFYYTEIGRDIEVIELLKTRLILGRTETRLDYDVDFNDVSFSDLSLPNYELSNNLPDIDLEDISLEDVSLEDITLEATIRN